MAQIGGLYTIRAHARDLLGMCLRGATFNLLNCRFMMRAMKFCDYTAEFALSPLFINDQLMRVVVNMDIFHVNDNFVVIAEYCSQFFQRNTFGFRKNEVGPHD